MKVHEKALFLAFGLAFWTLGTLWFEYRGQIILETTKLRYWLSFFLTPVVTAVFCILIFRWRHIPTSQWSSAALMLAIPGMFGEAILLSHLSTFMPALQPSSGGKYGAMLFATYAIVLSAAELVASATRP
ncbi:DUF5367 family protein [Granulicella sp. dw_53]|uniref:DUF5367 family protein n=1 Tax=Granulicella sp. dw_53 TaxID=2719792 RepID=UPI001BD5A8CB|nr:DUF5367 family protein [Granulicella sp. dw_53]